MLFLKAITWANDGKMTYSDTAINKKNFKMTAFSLQYMDIFSQMLKHFFIQN